MASGPSSSASRFAAGEGGGLEVDLASSLSDDAAFASVGVDSVSDFVSSAAASTGFSTASSAVSAASPEAFTSSALLSTAVSAAGVSLSLSALSSCAGLSLVSLLSGWLSTEAESSLGVSSALFSLVDEDDSLAGVSAGVSAAEGASSLGTSLDLLDSSSSSSLSAS